MVYRQYPNKMHAFISKFSAYLTKRQCLAARNVLLNVAKRLKVVFMHRPESVALLSDIFCPVWCLNRRL